MVTRDLSQYERGVWVGLVRSASLEPVPGLVAEAPARGILGRVFGQMARDNGIDIVIAIAIVIGIAIAIAIAIGIGRVMVSKVILKIIGN